MGNAYVITLDSRGITGLQGQNHKITKGIESEKVHVNPLTLYVPPLFRKQNRAINLNLLTFREAFLFVYQA